MEQLHTRLRHEGDLVRTMQIQPTLIRSWGTRRAAAAGTTRSIRINRERARALRQTTRGRVHCDLHATAWQFRNMLTHLFSPAHRSMPPRSARSAAAKVAAAAAAAPSTSSKARKGTKRRTNDEPDNDATLSAEMDAAESSTAARKMARGAEASSANAEHAPADAASFAASVSDSAAGSSSSSAAASFPASFRVGSCVLYRDVLQILLRFVDLSDVSRLLRVCRGWSGAVRGAPSVHGHFTPSILSADGMPYSKESRMGWARSVIASEVGARLQGIGALPYQTMMVDCAMLEEMARRMHALRSIAASLIMPLPVGGASPHFPTALTSLHLQFEKRASPRDIHCTLFNIAAGLQSLHTLALCLPHSGSGVHFNALAECKALRHLSLVLSTHTMLPAHLASLRPMGGRLHSLAVDLQSHQPSKLFAAPQPFAQLQELRPTKTGKPLVVDAAMERALASVPSLTKLHALWKGDDLAWLSALPSLRELRFQAWGSSLTPAQILPALAACTQLTSFELERGPGLWLISADQLATCISGMTHLQRLGVSGFADLTSLAFIPDAQRASQLSHVRLTGLDALPTAELRRLSAMQGLQHVEIDLCCQGSTALQLREIILAPPCSFDAAALGVRDTPRL